MSLYRCGGYFKMFLGVILTIAIVKGLTRGLWKLKDKAGWGDQIAVIFIASMMLPLVWFLFLERGIGMVNTNISFTRGILERTEFLMSEKGGNSYYDITLRSEEDLKLTTIHSVRTGDRSVIDRLQKGDQIEICLPPEADKFVSKVNGKERGEYQYYYSNEDSRNIFAEKMLVTMILFFHITVQVVTYIRERSRKLSGRKNNGAMIWLVGSMVYNLLMFLAAIGFYDYKILQWERVVPYLVSCAGEVGYVLENRGFKFAKSGFRKFWEEIQEEQKVLDEQVAPIFISNGEGNVEVFQQAERTKSINYCKYKFKKKVKESINLLVVVLIVLAIITFAVALFVASTKTNLVIKIGVGIGIGFFIIWGILTYRMSRKFRTVFSSKLLCEYCITHVHYNIETRFLCSNGHEKKWRLEEDDFTIKEGEEAVVVYLPAIEEIYTERVDLWEKISVD